jgi:hypothetical protein
LALGATALSALFATQTMPAQAAPTWGGGDCWRGATPTHCWVNWAGRNQKVLFYNVDNFSAAGRPNWHSAFITALQNWNLANGPQSLSTAGRTGANTAYYDFAFDGQYDLAPGVLGVTIICDFNNFCTDNLSQPLQGINRGYVRGNASGDGTPDNSGSLTVEMFAHETGHILGNAHTSTRSGDLMYSYVNGVTSPTDTGDIGAKPACSGSFASTNSNNERAGDRCVFGWDN